jgi:hypothetical protein
LLNLLKEGAQTRNMERLFLVAGLLCSQSATAYLMVFVAVTLYLFVLYRFRFYFLITSLVGLFCISGILFYKVENIISVKIVSDIVYRGARRLAGFSEISAAYADATYFQLLFGYGMNDALFESWASSVPRVIVFFGAIGSLIMVLWIALSIKGARDVPRRALLLMLVGLSMGTQVLLGSYLFLLIAAFVFASEHKWAGFLKS